MYAGDEARTLCPVPCRDIVLYASDVDPCATDCLPSGLLVLLRCPAAPVALYAPLAPALDDGGCRRPNASAAPTRAAFGVVPWAPMLPAKEGVRDGALCEPAMPQGAAYSTVVVSCAHCSRQQTDCAGARRRTPHASLLIQAEAYTCGDDDRGVSRCAKAEVLDASASTFCSTTLPHFVFGATNCSTFRLLSQRYPEISQSRPCGRSEVAM